MKNILIILGMTFLVGFLSMFITGSVLVKIDKAEQIKLEESQPPIEFDPSNPIVSLTESNKALSRSVEAAMERDRKVQIAGIIGLIVGLLSGIAITTVMDRKKKNTQAGS